MKIEIGKKAPDFTLYDTEKNKVSLSDYKGQNVVLLFFPFAFSSVCTAELCSVRDNLSLYNHTHSQVLGISVDSPFTLKKFKDDQSFNFRLLSDFNKEAITAYDLIYDVFPAMEMRGVAKRSALVVDKEGVIRYLEVCASPGDQPNYEAIQEAVMALN